MPGLARMMQAAAGATAAPSPLLTSLVSYWKLDEASGTRVDSHGSNDLTDNNTVLAATGKVGNAADFERDNAESLGRASNTDLQIGDNDFAFAFWFNAESLPNGAIQLVSKDATTARREYVIRTGGTPNSTGFIFDLYDGNTTRVARITQAALFSTATWYFVACWYDRAAGKIFAQINNTGTIYENTLTGTPGVNTEPFRIGASGGDTNYMDGLIDEVGFWKRVLTADERTSLWNGGAGTTYPFDAGGDPDPPPEPDAPISLVGFSSDTQDHLHSVRLFGNGQYALTADWGGNKVDCWDVSDPANPTILSSVAISTPLYCFVAPGEQYACAGTYTTSPYSFHMIDISNPSGISIVGTVSDAGLNGIQEIVFTGNYAFTAGRESNAIAVIDISTPVAPAIVGSISGIGAPNFLDGVLHLAVSADGNTLFACAPREPTVCSFDISDPPNIAFLDSVATNLANNHEIKYSNGYLYVANVYFSNRDAGSVTIYNATNPADLLYVTQVIMDGTDPENDLYLDYAHGLWIDGTALYVASASVDNGPGSHPACYEWSCSLTKIDITDPANPVVLWSHRDTTYLHGAQEVQKYGNYLFVACYGLPGLVIYEEV